MNTADKDAIMREVAWLDQLSGAATKAVRVVMDHFLAAAINRSGFQDPKSRAAMVLERVALDLLGGMLAIVMFYDQYGVDDSKLPKDAEADRDDMLFVCLLAARGYKFGHGMPHPITEAHQMFEKLTGHRYDKAQGHFAYAVAMNEKNNRNAMDTLARFDTGAPRQ